MFRKILIANRGEIACRIARSLRRMGVAVATIHSAADAQALHVREIGESVLVGGAPARESYLAVDAVVEAARQVGADAVHPGFGFLSENAQFAQRCAGAGLVFIGPSPQALALFGDKAAAKRLARSLGIPTAEGLEEPDEDVERLVHALSDLPLPFILKAVAGGGGKGMRVVHERAGLRESIEAAMREGRSAFGDGRLIAERYLRQPRHLEVQILGDGHGNVVHLFDRECSLQRRYQKVVEEAPVASVPQALREQLWAHAVALGRATSYLGLGTVEFAVSQGKPVFLEVNPRLQVEHPVTEAVLGLDLVRLQVETVARGALPLQQDEVPEPRGVAVQARLYAEDARRGFLPATGRIAVFEVPSALRVDAGVAAGSEVTPHYDPMIAKLVAHAPTRLEALQRLRDALGATTVLGVTTNRSFLADLLADPDVLRNEISTEFIDGWLAQRPQPPQQPRDIAVLAARWLRAARAHTRAQVQGAWGDAGLTGWRTRRQGEQALPPATHVATAADGAAWTIGFARRGAVLLVRVGEQAFAVEDAGGDAVAVDGCTLHVRSIVDGAQVHARIAERELSIALAPVHDAGHGARARHEGVVRAPMMGIVVAVNASEGQRVAAGERLATLESMKMEMALAAPAAGVVGWVGCAAQAKVERHQELFRIELDAS